MSRIDDQTAATLKAGRQRAEAGDSMEAERLLKGVLFDADTRNTYGGFVAAHYLAVTYGRCGRAFEAWVCGNAAAAWARVHGDVPALFLSLGATAACAAVLRDTGGLSQTLRELESLLEREGDQAHPWTRQDFHESSTKSAIFAGDAQRAREHLQGMEAELAKRLDAEALDTTSLCGLRSQVYLLEGRPDDAQAALEAAPSLPEDDIAQCCALDAAWVAALSATEAWDRAQEHAHHALSRLQATGERDEYAHLRIEIGRQIAPLWDRVNAVSEARATRNMMASGVFQRICQVDAWAEEFKDFDIDGLAQSKGVIQSRTEFIEGQRDVLRTIAKWFPDNVDAKRVVLGNEEGVANICGWCERLRSSSNGTWIPVGEFVPRDGSIRVSHSICESCVAEAIR